MAYGLTVTNNATPMMRAMMMAVQAHVLRTLLFDPAAIKLPKNRYLIQDNIQYIANSLIRNIQHRLKANKTRGYRTVHVVNVKLHQVYRWFDL